MEGFKELNNLVQAGDALGVAALTADLLNTGVQAHEILEEGLMAGMGEVGEKFKNNEVFVPEVMMSARAMNAGIEVLKPVMSDAGAKAKGKIVLGTVKGDMHDIGKNLVKIMMEGKGIEVLDLGTNVTPAKFVQTAIENNAKIIGCSALLTTTMPIMKQIVEETEKAGIRDKIKIMIGGAPVTPEYCEKIGADFYTPDAATAADVASKILNGEIP